MANFSRQLGLTPPLNTGISSTQRIPVSQILVEDRIRKDFGNIQELADDIKENGLINPPVVNRDFRLLAGERRLRACKELGWDQIEVRIMNTRDAEHELNVEISENETRKGFSKAERVDYMKRLMRIERAKAKERQGTRNDLSDNIPQNSAESRDAVADQFNISHDTMNKELSIVENKNLLSPEDFANWDEGKLSTNKAYQEIKKKLSEAEKKNTEMESQLSEVNKQLEEKTQNENAANSLEELDKLIPGLSDLLTTGLMDVDTADNLIDTFLTPDDKDELLKRHMPEDIPDNYFDGKSLTNSCTTTVELKDLEYKVQKLLEGELAPIRFGRFIDDIKFSDTDRRILTQLVDRVEGWVELMNDYLHPEASHIVEGHFREVVI